MGTRPAGRVRQQRLPGRFLDSDGDKGNGRDGRGPSAGRSREEILTTYPYLEPEDIDQALAYAAWRVEELEVPPALE